MGFKEFKTVELFGFSLWMLSVFLMTIFTIQFFIPEPYYTALKFDQIFLPRDFLKNFGSLTMTIAIFYNSGGAVSHPLYYKGIDDPNNIEDSYTRKKEATLERSLNKMEIIYDIPLSVVNRFLYDDIELED